MKLLFNQLEAEILKANYILFVSHRNPDPDTIGSALALGWYIESMGKKVEYFCKDKLPDNFLILSNAKAFVDNSDIFKNKYDLVIFFDIADIGRIAIDNLLEYKQVRWIRIDHHLSVDCFADFEVVNESASSTCEIVYEFLKHMDIEINLDVATALLSGLLIDTGFLSNNATSIKAIGIASYLISCGAQYNKILKAFYLNKNPELLRLWGLILERLKYNKDKDLATTAIFKKDAEFNLEIEEGLSGLSNFLNSLLNYNVIMVLREKDLNVYGSLRTGSDNIDVSEIAALYGGGGHKRAAGFLCKGRIVEIENEWKVELAN